MEKIALAMITKGDEAKHIERCLSSIKPYIDGIFITITTEDEGVSEVVEKFEGTSIKAPYKFHREITKKEIKWLKDFGLEAQLKEKDKIFEFDKARNFSFEQVPEEYEFILWLDSDDILKGGQNIKKIVNQMQTDKIDAVFFNYLYQVEVDDKGQIRNVLIEHLRERIVRRGKYKWVAPIHETLIPQQEVKQIDSKFCEVIHLSDDDRMQNNLGRNVKTLEMSIYDTQGKDPRPLYYLGKSYFDEATVNGKSECFDIASFLFDKYLHGEFPSGWAEERAQCWDYLAEIYRAKGELNSAIKCNMGALIEYPQNPGSYISIALTYIVKKEWERAMHWLKLALSFKKPDTTLVVNPKELEGRSHEVVYHYAINTAKLDMAVESAKALVQLSPENTDFKDRLNFAMGLVEQRELTRNVIALAKHLSMGQSSKLKPLLNALPKEIASNPFIVDLYQKVYPPRVHEDDEISIYCGPGFTNWSPSLMENPKGSFMGGSEEAVVYLSRELSKLGWKVTVYGDPVEKEEDNGVTYLPYFEFNPRDEFNIFVAWRQVGLVDMNLKAKQLYVWNHDVINPLEYTQERLDKITKIFVLSPAHRRNIPKISDDKVVISANGVGGML